MAVAGAASIAVSSEPAIVMPTVRLGIDLGELDDEPEALYAYAHFAYVAAGAHAGDERTIARAIDRATRSRCVIGAHPGFEDRARFGRVELDLASEVLAKSVRKQCVTVREAAALAGREVRVMKLHGALYHRADRDAATAESALRGAIDALGEGLTVVAWPGRETARAAARLGCAVLREAFADRGARADGTLLARHEPGALLTERDAAVARAHEIIVAARADVLCVHGDNPSAVAIARAVRAMLDEAST